MRTFRNISILLLISFLVGCNPGATVSVPPASVTAPSIPAPTTLPTLIPTSTPHAILSTAETAINFHLLQLHFIDPLIAFGIGGSGINTRLIITKDGGKSWSDSTPPALKSIVEGTNLDLIAAFRGNNRIWLTYSGRLGEPIPDEKVFYSDDAGVTWSESSLLDKSGLSESFFISDLFFVDDSHGWLVAHVGGGMNHDYLTIYRTLDGGSSWSRIVDPINNDAGIQSCSKNGIWFADSQHGWLTGSCNGVAAGVLLYRTVDGGTTWQGVDLPVPVGYESLFSMESGYCGSNPIHESNGSIIRIEVACRQVSPVETVVFFDAISQNNGSNWSITKVDQSRQNMYMVDQVHAIDLNQVWRWSDDGGVSWTLATIEPEWQGYGIDFQAVDTSHWYALTWNDGKTNLAISTDQGKNWTMINPAMVGK